jgi:hypothetical protein
MHHRPPQLHRRGAWPAALVDSAVVLYLLLFVIAIFLGVLIYALYRLVKDQES